VFAARPVDALTRHADDIRDMTLETDDGLTPGVRSDAHVLATWRNVLCVGLLENPTTDTTDAVEEAVARLSSQHEGGIGLVHIVLTGATTPPAADVRGAYLRMMSNRDTATRGSAVVLPTGGFGAAIVNSVIAGLQLATRAPFPTRVFPAVPEACTWLAGRLDSSGVPCGSVDELERAITRFSTELEQARRENASPG
jgi:hypothetical protein